MGNAPSSPSYLPPSACPVDNSTREAWLKTQPPPAPQPSQQEPPTPSTCPVDPTARAAWQTSQPSIHSNQSSTLPTTRVTSSIPRAPTTTTPTTTPSPQEGSTETDLTTQTTQNWIYPSEKQFFEAMLRKQHSPTSTDMRTVVPLHNAVNERAWSLIKTWERHLAGPENAPCGGPWLRSFEGDSGKLSPKARVRGWVGYELPFDRHDWVVQRCGGGEVVYVIDFYRGRGSKGGGVSFFLDVRPKLDRWEGWRMRFWGLVGGVGAQGG